MPYVSHQSHQKITQNLTPLSLFEVAFSLGKGKTEKLTQQIRKPSEEHHVRVDWQPFKVTGNKAVSLHENEKKVHVVDFRQGVEKLQVRGGGLQHQHGRKELKANPSEYESFLL